VRNVQAHAVKLRVLVLTALLIGPVAGDSAAPAKARASLIALPPDDSHSAKGLELQYQLLDQAYSSGNSAEIDRTFAGFSLPNPTSWFSKHFAQEHAERLAQGYRSDLEIYKQAILNSMRSSPPGTAFRVRCKIPHPDRAAWIQPRADAPQPIVPIQIEQFETEWRPERSGKAERFSMFVSYVYVDGAFRYVGRGAYPFWSMPDAIRK
jgi:hypothetical protein